MRYGVTFSATFVARGYFNLIGLQLLTAERKVLGVHGFLKWIVTIGI